MCDVSILIASFNTCDYTLSCLQSVFAQTRGIDFEVIVVDNASTDGSADLIAANFPAARLIRSDTNLGFARANNVAAAQARGEFLLLLNPDTVILDGAIQKAVALAKARPRVGILGGRTLFSDGSLNHTSVHARPTPWSVFCQGIGLSSVFRRSSLFNREALWPWRRDGEREVDIVTGCFLLIRRKLWLKLQGFDESFFMYGEDTDLCIRAWNIGATCVCCPEVQLIHHGGRSERVRSDKMVRLFAAKAQLFQKHWDTQLVPFGLLMLKSWAFTRMSALALLQWLQPQRRAAYHGWREVWRRRDEYDLARARSAGQAGDLA